MITSSLFFEVTEIIKKGYEKSTTKKGIRKKLSYFKKTESLL